MDKLRDRLTRTFTGSASAALLALLMVGAIALGANVVRPMTAGSHHDATTAQADTSSDAREGGSEGTDATEPQGNGAGPATDTSAPDEATCQDEQGHVIPCTGEEPPSEPPAEEPPSTPPSDPPSQPPSHDPAPSTDLTLVAVFNADMGKIVVEWSAFGGSFDKYKLVRSTDGEASWPLGEGDQLVGVVGKDGNRRFVDGDAPCNTEFHYRAFAVRHTETGYAVLASSNVGAATRACSDQPPADPTAMGFEVVQSAEGVQLTWDACGSDAFAAYKVVRSATNPNPMYPLNDGTQLLVYFHDQGTTQFTDSDVEAGQTWTYRVLCMGHNGDGYYALALTDAVTVTVE